MLCTAVIGRVGIHNTVVLGYALAGVFYRPTERTFRLFGWTGLFLVGQ